MRHIFMIFIVLMLALSGCRNVSVGMSTGNVSIGTGGGSTGVGVHTRSGSGVYISTSHDFLYSGNSETYANNKLGVSKLLEKKYPEAKSIFQATLDKAPEDPDATYYMGLTQIYLENRQTGYETLRRYRDPLNYRITQQVKWWADYCEKKPELTAKRIHEVMNKARSEGYRKEQEEYWDRRW